jgi:hypothetical protein
MFRYILVCILAGMILTSCLDRPTFPDVPSISVNEFYFKEIPTDDGSVSIQDSLVIKLQFEDGNGDLGLASNETSPPYHLYDIVLVGNDTLKYGDNDTLPTYNCFDYEIIRRTVSIDGSLQVTSDTIFVIRNPNHFNFFLTFLVEQNGDFVEYNFWEIQCAPPFNGRFFNLNTQGDIRPLTGELRYGVLSSFRLLFRNYPSIKMQLQIQDKALNKSNILVTEAFRIDEIIRR